jgi:hypothetical protein
VSPTPFDAAPERTVKMNREMAFKDDVVLHGSALVSAREGEFAAKLTLNPSRIPTLSPDKPISVIDLATRPELGSKHEMIQFETSDDYYTLLDADQSNGQYFPWVVVKGPKIHAKEQMAFARVHLGYSNLTKWVMGRSHFESDESEIRYKLIYRKFEERVVVGDREISVGLSYHPDWKSDNNEKRLIERVMIDCTPVTGLLSLDDCRNLEKDFALILTLLIGTPSTIDIMIAELGKKLAYITYPAAHSSQSLSEDWHAVHNNRYLCEHGKWAVILTTYYTRRERFRRLWSRVFSMMNYNDVWDYRVLGYVSILQNYLDQKRAMTGPQLPDSVKQPLKRQARAWTKRVRSKLGRHDRYRPEWEAIFDEMEAAIGRYSFGIRYSYAEKFQRLLLGMDARLVEILSFGIDDFAFLKDLRDGVGHGTDRFGQQSFDRLATLESKVVLLILSLAYQDLGLDAEDVIIAYGRSFNQFILGAALNRVSLDRYAERILFVKVPTEVQEKVLSLRAPFVVLEQRKSTQQIRFSEAKSGLVRNWHRNAGDFRLLRDYVQVKLYEGRSGVELMDPCGASAYLESEGIKEPTFVHGLVQVLLADGEWVR